MDWNALIDQAEPPALGTPAAPVSGTPEGGGDTANGGMVGTAPADGNGEDSRSFPSSNSDLFPPVPTKTEVCSHLADTEKTFHNNALCNLFPLFPVFPLKNSGREVQTGETDTPGAAGRPENPRARNGGVRGTARAIRYPLHPQATTLTIAWARAAEATLPELVAFLAGLTKDPMPDQLRVVGDLCRERGLVPWKLLTYPSPGEGAECMGCKHMTSANGYLDGSRRYFRWACGKGYQIMEYARESERVAIAPPECESWDRWYPSAQQ